MFAWVSSAQRRTTALLSAWLRLYVDGFGHMTWGRTLWVIILVKLVVIFGVMRWLFFAPYLSATETEAADAVGSALVDRGAQP